MLSQARLCFSAIYQLTFSRLAGHSKWANIRHIKALKDSQKASLNEKYARMVRLAIQDGGGSTNPALNSHLKTVMDQALKVNVPLGTINNQIKKFNAKDAQLKRYFIEMKTMNRIFLIVEVYTENFAGSRANINTAIRKSGQSSVADVKHMFDEVGFIQATITAGKFSNATEFEDMVTEHAIECDAQEVEDIDFDTKSASFVCRPFEIEKVKRILLNLGYEIEFAEHIFVPQRTLQITEDEAKTYENLKHRLSQVDGVENIYDNVEPPST